MIRRALQALPFVAAALVAPGCGDDGSSPPPPTDWDAIDPIVYSQHVQPLFDGSCNTAECHNATDRAMGLSLASYADVAQGSSFGAVILPFEPEHSHLIEHVEGRLEPRMPLGRDPLDPAAIRFLRRWIGQGAKNDDGSVMYGQIAQKAFVACQAEDEVAVLDLATGLRIRAIHVVAPHSVYVDELTRRLFVTRFEDASDNIHVYDGDTLELVASGRAGTRPALMKITPDGTQLWVTNFDISGADNAVYVLDPNSPTLAAITSFNVPNQQLPHGLAVKKDGSTVYVANIQSDNVSIYCTGCDLVDPGQPAFLGTVPLPDAGVPHQPQQCVVNESGTRLFVSALGSDRVYVMNTVTETFVGEAAVGDAPWHLALSTDESRLWVANWVGESVSVLDVTNPNTPTPLATLSPGHPMDPERLVVQRPIGVSFSPDGRAWVACANDDDENTGHHPPPEGEKNPGNVVVFDPASLEVLFVTEVPHFARFVTFLP